MCRQLLGGRCSSANSAVSVQSNASQFWLRNLRHVQRKLGKLLRYVVSEWSLCGSDSWIGIDEVLEEFARLKWPVTRAGLFIIVQRSRYKGSLRFEAEQFGDRLCFRAAQKVSKWEKSSERRRYREKKGGAKRESRYEGEGWQTERQRSRSRGRKVVENMPQSLESGISSGI